MKPIRGSLCLLAGFLVAGIAAADTVPVPQPVVVDVGPAVSGGVVALTLNAAVSAAVVFSSCRRRVDIRVSNSRYMDCSNSFSGHLQQCGGNMLTATALVMLGEAVI